MSTDELKDKFSTELNGLTHALQRHHEPVPADFTTKVLRKLRQTREQKILARVVLWERLAVAGCVVFCCAAFVVTVFLQNIIASFFERVTVSVSQSAAVLTDKILQAIGAFSTEWQTYIVFALALGFAAYNIIELFCHDRLKTA
jgi:hypothetical protein